MRFNSRCIRINVYNVEKARGSLEYIPRCISFPRISRNLTFTRQLSPQSSVLRAPCQHTSAVIESNNGKNRGTHPPKDHSNRKDQRERRIRPQTTFMASQYQKLMRRSVCCHFARMCRRRHDSHCAIKTHVRLYATLTL